MKAGVIGLLGFGGAAAAPTLDDLGADLLYHWEPSAETVTLNGSNVSALEERVAGVGDAVQATAGNQPAYSSSGGPNDRPYIDSQDTGRHLVAAISVAAGHRVGIYYVCKPTAAGSGSRQLRITGPAGTHLTLDRGAGPVYSCFNRFTSSAPTVNATTSPAFAEDWHLFSFRPLASGALFQIDGATTDPNFGTSDTVTEWLAAGVASAQANADGSWCFLALVDDPTAAKDAIVKEYVAFHFGLTLS